MPPKNKTELGREEAPGTCPSCGGKVDKVCTNESCTCCCIPVGSQIKIRYVCTKCKKPLELVMKS